MATSAKKRNTDKPVIAISGLSGCGNTTVGKLVAEMMGYELVNYTFHTIAEEENIPFDEVLEQARQSDARDRQVDTRQVEMARKGNTVLSSRLAIWMLEHEALIKIYLYASPQARGERIHNREKGDPLLKMRETERRDREDRERYKALYGIDNTDVAQADLVINTEIFGPEEIAGIICSAARTLL